MTKLRWSDPTKERDPARTVRDHSTITVLPDTDRDGRVRKGLPYAHVHTAEGLIELREERRKARAAKVLELANHKKAGFHRGGEEAFVGTTNSLKIAINQIEADVAEIEREWRRRWPSIEMG